MRSGRLSRAVFVTSIIAALAVFSVAAVSGAGTRVRPALATAVTPPLPPYLGLSGPHPFIGQHLPAGLFANYAQRPVSAAQAGTNPYTDLTPDTLASSEIEPCAGPNPTTNSIAFSSNGVDANKDGIIDPTLPVGTTPYYHVWIMRPDGSNQIQVTNGAGDEREPCYDPGGRWIAYSSNATGTYQIYTINLNTQAVYQLTTGPGDKHHPSYSPGTTWIVYSSDQSGTPHIYKVPAAGGAQPVQITNGAGETEPAYSTTTNQILYTGVVGGHTRIFLTDDQGSTPEQLSDGGNDPNADDNAPAWYPNNSAIAFSSDRKTSGIDPHANYNVWQMTAQGEINGTDAILLATTDESSDAQNVHPTLLPANDRNPVRLVWASNSADATRATYDIWTALSVDDTPPVLVDKPSIDGPRQTTPGADVTIHVPVYDADSGVAAVTAILKDPSQKIWADDPSVIWAMYGADGDSAMGHFFATDGTFDASHLNGVRHLEYDFATVGQVTMHDDGDVGTDGDTVAGDGIFSGIFSTSTIPHDYVIDIVVQDNAGNVFTYDNVYGFTTQAFTPKTGILFVDDYCEGQKFLFWAGNNNMLPAGWPDESYWLKNPSYYPGIPVHQTGGPDAPGFTDEDSLAGYYDMGYDVWRILCRGPVPQSVYAYYLPTVEYQLDPQEAQSDPTGATADKRVLVADKCIVWAAPHSGDVWTGSNSGDILDAATQADLGLFLDRGGRLLIGGENIAWALTLNGTVQNDFLTTYLHANFLADNPPPVTSENDFYAYLFNTGQEWRMLNACYGFSLTSQASDPVASDPWVVAAPYYAIHEDCYDPDDRPYQDVLTPTIPGSASDPWYTDCSEFSIRPDVITPINPNELLYSYGKTFGAAGEGAGIRYSNESTGAKVVYFAFGFEQIDRRYHTVNQYDHCRNFRSHLLHNACCWLRTGGFQGKVISVSDGGQPISKPPYPIITAYANGNMQKPTAAIRAQADGTFVLNGLPPNFYSITCTRPGYSIQHFDGWFIHGGVGFYYPVDFTIKLADPGAIAGVVTSAADGTAINNVTITVQAVPTEVTNADGTTTEVWPGNTTSSDWPKTYTTSSDGTYTAGDLPPGTYDVTADGSAVGFGTVGPQSATVTSNNVTHVDFQLPAANGTVVAIVTDANTSQPIQNATVTVKTSTTVAGTGLTDATGTAQISVQPGSYSVTADAPGYGTSSPQTTTVVSDESTNPPLQFAMTPQAPGVVTGRVVSAVSGLPVGGVQVLLIAPGQANQSVTTTATLQQDSPSGIQYNFKFANAPAGTVTIRPQPVGFSSNPAETSVTVASGATTANVVFQLTSLHTFATGLQLMSLPGDYTAFDPAGIFNLGSGQTLHMAAFESSSQQYSMYPMAPADRIRPGVGYWLFLNGTSDLTTTGGFVASPVSVPLNATWNLVGDPYPGSIDVYSTQVRTATGTVYDWQTARQRGLILSSLWAYVIGTYQPSGSLNPYIGYWVACSQPLTFLINNTTTTAAPKASPADLLKPATGWGLPLTVKCGAASDAYTFLGVASTASDGFDAGLDQLKPPTPPSGPYVTACALLGGGSGDRSHLAVDMRPRAGETYTVQVQTDQVGQPVTITWPDLSGLPKDVRPVLTDTVAGKSVYMRTSTGYTYTARENQRDLQITLQSSAGSAMAVSALHATEAAAGQVQIVYTLSCAATVDVQVLNMSGLTVRTLASDGVATAGQNTVVWDGRNERGSMAPSGRYLVVVRARSENGEQTSAVAALQLGR